MFSQISPRILALALVLFAAACTQPHKPVEEAPAPAAHSYTVTVQEDASKTNFPALQSFALGSLGDIDANADGTTEEAWLMFGGRTNSPAVGLNGGLHNLNAQYSSDTSFPALSFNTNFYVYIPSLDLAFSAPVNDLVNWTGSADLQNVFQSTNLQVCQVDTTLYLTGGYKVLNTTPNTGITYDYMVALDLPRVMLKVVAKSLDPTATVSIQSNMAWTKNSYVKATGGELKYLDNGKFNLVVGQDFYGHPGAETQVYLNAVRTFTASRSGNSITISDTASISDGKNVCLTQFRRRDLCIVPWLDATGANSYAIYSGVFSCGSGAYKGGVCNQGNCGGAWANPIYFAADGSYTVVDTNDYRQSSNFYATSNVTVYDSESDSLYTTLVGGIGDAPGSFSFTNKVLTIARSKSGGKPIDHPQAALSNANFYGAESQTVATGGFGYNGSEIIDGTKLTSTPTQVAYMVGGIEAFATNPGTYGTGNSAASSKVFKIMIARN